MTLWTNILLSYFGRRRAAFLCLETVLVSPFAHLVKNGYEGFSTVGETVFNFRRYLWIFLPVDELVSFQFLKGGTEGLIGNVSDIFFHFVEPDDAELHQGIEDGHFILPVDEG